MIQLTHRRAIAIGGTVWMVVGLTLLIVGLRLLESSLLPAAYTPLLSSFEGLSLSRDNGVIFLIVLALIIGQLKGRAVLEKAANREVLRIKGLPNPLSLAHLYSPRYYILMVIMMGVGMCMNVFQVPPDIRGAIDTAVGVALVRGALAYFRLMPSTHQPTISKATE